jgi:hypothetical protein
MLFRRLAILVLLLTCSTPVTSQQIENTRTKVDSASKPTEVSKQPEYVIEVSRPGGCSFAPIELKRNGGLFLTALPRSAKPVPDSAGRVALSKLVVEARRDGERWKVKVVLGSGEFYDAGDQEIASFVLDTNEHVTVTEAVGFGLPSLRVGVMKVIEVAAEKPTVNSLVQSISVEKIQANKLPEPYRVELKNNSQSDVIAVQYNIFKGDRFLDLKWRSNGLVNPLLKSGAIYPLEVVSEDKACSDVDGYRPGQSTRIDVVSVVFADGSFEGQFGLATLIKATAAGNKLHLRNVVAALDYLDQGGQFDPIVIGNQLRFLRESLGEVAEPLMITTVQKSLPMIPADSGPAIASFLRSGMHEIRTSLERDERAIEVLSKRNNPELIKAWWSRTYQKYKTWLATAESVSR